MPDYGKYKIHPIADKFELLVGDEFAKLVASIAEYGLQSDITLAADGITLVDGRNRYLACYEARVDPRYITLPASFTEEQTVAYIVNANMRRRDMTVGQKSMMAVDIGEHLAVEAKKRQARKPAAAEANSVPANSPEQNESREAAAKTVGVGSNSVQRAKKVVQETPEAAEAVRKGTMSLNDAYKQARMQEKARGEAIPKPDAPPPPAKTTVSLPTHTGDIVEYPLPASKPTFNPANDHISWAAYTWNPVTGCLHGCKYCYAREIATKAGSEQIFPVGFTPLFHRERLNAPANTKPRGVDTDPKQGRVFVCSMADLYGKWVPDTWIEQVHASCIANPQWEYLLLTKFPERYNHVRLPPTAWVGTSVDEQKRVRIAEAAFAKISSVAVKWLSLEPLREDLRFTDLSMFDWVVIGSQTSTRQPDGVEPAFAPPFEWVSRIVAQAREAGCKVWLKPNLLGNVHPQSPGMQLPQEVPDIARAQPQMSLLA